MRPTTAACTCARAALAIVAACQWACGVDATSPPRGGSGGEPSGAADAARASGGASPEAGGAPSAAGGAPATGDGGRDAGHARDSGASGAPGDGSIGSAASVPADVLDLTNWKLTLPTGSPGAPTEILQPDLAAFSLHPYFELDAARDGVVFQANAGGVTTSGSGYPRSELREMINGGASAAAWSMNSGVHTMTITEAITHLPVVKPQVVAGQIHDATDDVVMVRLEGQHLFLEGGGTDLGTLDPSYRLGARFTVRLVASGGHIRAYYDDLGTPKVDVQRSASGCYFKAGVYTQSNTSKGDAPDAYGEVVIYDLVVTHQ
jgi:poly(beta-D-mannuronate) lyase